MLNKCFVREQLLNERWYLIYMICHTLLIAMLTRKIWVIAFSVLLMYIIRGLMSIIYMVNGVESYVPSKSFGPFFFPGDEQYFHIPGFRFRIRLSPATYDGIGVIIASLAYLASMLMICFNEERSSSIVIANAVFLGAGLGSLKNGARASRDYQENMKKAKVLFMQYQGNLSKLRDVEEYRQLQVSSHYEKIWSQELNEHSQKKRDINL